MIQEDGSPGGRDEQTTTTCTSCDESGFSISPELVALVSLETLEAARVEGELVWRRRARVVAGDEKLPARLSVETERAVLFLQFICTIATFLSPTHFTSTINRQISS